MMIGEELLPVHDVEAEEQLKRLITEIEEMIGDADASDIMEEKLVQAKQYVKAKNRVLDMDVIEQYESWTTLQIC